MFSNQGPESEGGLFSNEDNHWNYSTFLDRLKVVLDQRQIYDSICENMFLMNMLRGSLFRQAFQRPLIERPLRNFYKKTKVSPRIDLKDLILVRDNGQNNLFAKAILNYPDEVDRYLDASWNIRNSGEMGKLEVDSKSILLIGYSPLAMPERIRSNAGEILVAAAENLPEFMVQRINDDLELQAKVDGYKARVRAIGLNLADNQIQMRIIGRRNG